MAEKTIRKQRHGFQPGQSGNPSGRPRGSLNRTTQAAQTLLDGEAEKLTRRALNGACGATLRCEFALTEFCPSSERVVNLDLPDIACMSDAAKAISAILKAVGAAK